MKLSKEIEAITLTFMNALKLLRPEMIQAQEALFVELCKGKDRNMLSIMDQIIAVGEKGSDAAKNFIDQCTVEGGIFIQGQISEVISAYQSGDFSKFEGISEELRLAIISNRTFNKNLEAETVRRFGEMAMTRALMEDGLVEEFKRRALLSMNS